MNEGTAELGGMLEAEIVSRARREVNARRIARVGVARWANRWIPAHWLATFNVANAIIVVGTVLAPWLRMRGYDGLAGALYAAYHLQCLQRSSHSLFLFGYKMGMEERMVAIYAGWLAAGLCYAARRARSAPLRTALLVALSLPMLLDAGVQGIGWSDGTLGWRVATGLLFAAASAWWGLPRAQLGLRSRPLSASRSRVAASPLAGPTEPAGPLSSARTLHAGATTPD